MEQKYNLKTEPWIKLRDFKEKIHEVSLEEALIHAQNYVGIAGDSATQDAAILRFLEAMTITIISRMNTDGIESPLEDEEEALERWKEIWDQGHLPEKAIKKYLEEYHDRFYLIDDHRPFAQSLFAENGTTYASRKLNGTLFESNNKARLFSLVSGKEKDSLDFASAARWLLNMIGIDDNSSKAKGKNLPTIGVGWLGKIKQIYAIGNNLFETLMLNCVLLKNGEELWGENKPYWELSDEEFARRDKERVCIAQPDNLAELLTLQSRRILLKEKDDQIVGYSLLGGDFFDPMSGDAEQFTLWDCVKDKKGQTPIQFRPARIDIKNPSRQIWRDFGSLAGISENEEAKDEMKMPGLIHWIALLKKTELIPENKVIQFISPYVVYGDAKYFFIGDISSQTMILYPSLFTQIGEQWRVLIIEEVKKIDKAARALGYFALDAARASGNAKDSLDYIRDEWSSKAYAAIDQPFLKWLSTLDPNQCTTIAQQMKKIDEWHKIAYQIFLKLSKSLTDHPPVITLLGREVHINDKKVYIKSIPEAEQIYKSQLRKFFLILKEGRDGNEKTTSD